ncbi:unnamed protein product [Mesocestoides corti]|uniref:Uncharacterized protein n=1 Tax=Mesocestoides corti TaxID=53468 RepID=A0A0R3ULE5_MESCO|nr:unnamed protein product [Mesocestoides corti]
MYKIHSTGGREEEGGKKHHHFLRTAPPRLAVCGACRRVEGDGIHSSSDAEAPGLLPVDMRSSEVEDTPSSPSPVCTRFRRCEAALCAAGCLGRLLEDLDGLLRSVDCAVVDDLGGGAGVTPYRHKIWVRMTASATLSFIPYVA